ncbi:MAG: hypothetical protein Q8K07_21075 [Methylicorpusculum sp.]|uniref:hypothetical protein n=1 Tax=Methylicorpusculum sp. TaxID=2713644 RepID=UPI0027309419|nr:hypothetical protein [Methylicorpusculum sp.]MDP2204517.1 hypothetical protein [Methylicorpusculum sp.]
MNNLSEDLDLTSSKLDNTEKAKNELVTKIVIHLDLIDFNLSDSNANVLGAAYVYLISEFAICAGKKRVSFTRRHRHLSGTSRSRSKPAPVLSIMVALKNDDKGCYSETTAQIGIYYVRLITVQYEV